MFVLKACMSIKFPLNDLLNLVSKAERSGRIKEAVSLIDTHINELAGSEQQIAKSVKEYLQSKLPQSAAEVSARAQVEMSLQLNKIKNLFSRINKETIIKDATTPPVDRTEHSLLVENLKHNINGLLNPRGRDFWISKYIDGTFDGLSGKEYDLRFMLGAQRLVDLGIIDDSTLVILHTGHNIPVAHRLMQNKHLGEVNGVLEFSRDTFPLMSEKVKNILELFAKGEGKAAGFSKEDTAILNELIKPLKRKILHPVTGEQAVLDEYVSILEQCAKRINDQNYTYPGTLEQIVSGKGTKYLGIDFHRTAKVDTTKLPTAKELKEAGIKKVVFLDEMHPVSTFNEAEIEQMYEPMTQDKIDTISALFDMFLSNMYQGKTKEGLKAIFTLDRFIAPADIRQKITVPDAAKLNEVKEKIQKGSFGYKPEQITRGDMVKYVQNLQSNMPVLIEGIDLYRLEHFPYENLISGTDRLLKQERNKFIETSYLSDLIALVNSMLCKS